MLHLTVNWWNVLSKQLRLLHGLIHWMSVGRFVWIIFSFFCLLLCLSASLFFLCLLFKWFLFLLLLSEKLRAMQMVSLSVGRHNTSVEWCCILVFFWNFISTFFFIFCHFKWFSPLVFYTLFISTESESE